MADRPTVRLLFTEAEPPYTGDRRRFEAVRLGSPFDVWRSTERPGWTFKFSEWAETGPTSAIIAARKSDVARNHGDDLDGDTVWYLTQDCHAYQSSLVARWAAVRLVELYSRRLAELRDRASAKRAQRLPVRYARDFDSYLMGDGLDALTVTSDLLVVTGDLRGFRWGVPEYQEDLSPYPPDYRAKHEARELVPLMCDWLRDWSSRLKADSDATIANIRASAELQQAVANTRLQRIVLALSFVAIVIAVVSLLLQ